MKKNNINLQNLKDNLFSLWYFFSGNAKTNQSGLSYFLIGHRNNQLIVRISQVYENLERLNLFLNLIVSAKNQWWILSWGPKSLYASRWLGAVHNVNFYNRVTRRYSIIKFGSRFFYLEAGAFNYSLFRVLNLGVGFLFCKPPTYAMCTLFSLRAAGVPLIGLNSDLSTNLSFLFGFPGATTCPKTTLFFGRLILSTAA